MISDNVSKSVKQIIQDFTGISVDEIKPSDKLIEDLGVDSFGMLTIRTMFEERFKIIIPDRDILEILVVERAIDYIFQKINPQ